MTDDQRRCKWAAFGAFLLAGIVGVLGGVWLDASVFVVLGAACLVGAGATAVWLN